MKFWQKIFLCSMLLFTLAFDVGAYILVRDFYEESLQREINNSVREEAVIASSIQSTISNTEEMLNASSLNQKILYTVTQSLAEYYKGQMVNLGLYYKDQVIYSNLPVSDDQWVSRLGAKEKMVESRIIEGDRYLFVVSRVPGYSDISLVYTRNINEVEVSKRESIQLFMMVNIGVVLLFGGIIFVMLKRLTNPIYDLIHITSKIADGNYEERVKINRRDEFGELGQVFDQMAGAVESNIEELTKQTLNKQIFIDDLAHEMKTPMTSIMGYSSLLMKANLSEEQRESATYYIHSSAKRLTHLSEKLLELANLTTGQLEIKTISVKQLLQELKEQMSLSLEKRKLTLHTSYTIETMQGDETLLLSMLCNLVENAARASTEGTTITVSVYQDIKTVIEVQDQGCGMPESEAEKIMLPFYKLDKARTRENGGVGLGLSIVQQIAQVHHGTIEIKSKIGLGTTVKVIFSEPCKEV